MPASMIRPDTGSRWNVSGSSIAMVAIGPMPGRTPISVPMSAPTSANPRFAGVSATANPVARLLRSSIAYQSGQTGMVNPRPRMKIAHDSAISPSAAMPTNISPDNTFLRANRRSGEGGVSAVALGGASVVIRSRRDLGLLPPPFFYGGGVGAGVLTRVRSFRGFDLHLGRDPLPGADLAG